MYHPRTSGFKLPIPELEVKSAFLLSLCCCLELSFICPVFTVFQASRLQFTSIQLMLKMNLPAYVSSSPILKSLNLVIAHFFDSFKPLHYCGLSAAHCLPCCSVNCWGLSLSIALYCKLVLACFVMSQIMCLPSLRHSFIESGALLNYV